METEQGNFVLDPVDQIVSKSLLQRGQYGLDSLERAAGFLSPRSDVLLLGAHVGAIAVPLSRRCQKLVAIEANPTTYKLLLANLLLNCCNNVEPYNIAANDCDEKIEFVLNTHNSGGSKRMPIYKDPIYFYDSPRITKVRGVRIDALLPNRRFELIFMDIEGSEYFAFLGMPNILTHANALIVEFLPHHLSRVAGKSVSQFLAPVMPYFDSLSIPSRGIRVNRADFLKTLESMFNEGRSDEGIVFQKLGTRNRRMVKL
ncbi:MAG: FkbM family methyltransferase [Ginsengibacter sp.]